MLKKSDFTLTGTSHLKKHQIDSIIDEIRAVASRAVVHNIQSYVGEGTSVNVHLYELTAIKFTLSILGVGVKYRGDGSVMSTKIASEIVAELEKEKPLTRQCEEQQISYS